MNVVIDDRADDASVEALAAILRQHNEGHTGPARREPFAFFARSPDDRVVGGIRGWTVWSWAYVDWLAVDKAHRGQRLGRELLARAEAIARERSCIGVYLWTTDFQAPGFYARHGYTAFGRLPDHPPGSISHWVFKRF